jgi:Na+/H+ antiporter NhaD/arsenite permease-like protein
MLTSVVLCFFIGYVIIILEQPLKLDKSVPALLMGAMTWALISVGHLEVLDANHQVTPLEDGLLHILGKTAEILFFLLGAMTIVELVDLHKGFSPITSLVKTKNKVSG